ncbi:MAG: hypothetical protein ACKOW9_00405 [Candidatus Paceibacterota bacterium]
MIMTSFGTFTHNPNTAASYLRARALREGVELKKASELDLLASVLAAESWLFITKGDLSHPRHHGKAAVLVAAAILSRASGNADAVPNDFTIIHNLNQKELEKEMLSAVESLHRLSDLIYTNHAKKAFEIVAYDLYASHPETGAERFLDFAYLLHTYSENI